jgi:hypothetical protein
MVISYIRSAAEYQAQEPSMVEDGSDVWKIRGSIELKSDAVPGDPSPIKMSISKLDGAIVSYFD